MSGDPLAAALAGDEGFRWMEEMRLPGTPVENPTIGPRTRYFDDLVLTAVKARIPPGRDSRSGPRAGRNH